MAPPFEPPLGMRPPKEGDRALAFEAAGLLKGNLSLEEVLAYHDPDGGQFTLFLVEQGELAGAACFLLREQDVLIDFLTRNESFVRRGVAVGTRLLRAVEDFARLHDREASGSRRWKIRLCSIGTRATDLCGKGLRATRRGGDGFSRW